MKARCPARGHRPRPNGKGCRLRWLWGTHQRACGQRGGENSGLTGPLCVRRSVNQLRDGVEFGDESGRAAGAWRRGQRGVSTPPTAAPVLERVCAGVSAALAYARTHFGQFQHGHMKEIQQLMCCLVFSQKPLHESPYHHLLSTSALQDVIQDFVREACGMLGQVRTPSRLHARRAAVAPSGGSDTAWASTCTHVLTRHQRRRIAPSGRTSG